MKKISKVFKKIKSFRLTPQIVATLYVLSFMVGYQLFVYKYYEGIQDGKLYYMLFSTMAALGLLVIIYLVNKLRSWFSARKQRKSAKKLQHVKDAAQTMDATQVMDTAQTMDADQTADAAKTIDTAKVPLLVRLKALFLALSLPERFAAAFITVVLLSTLFSQNRYEAFWGSMGRLQGCYAWIFYMAGYFIITRLYQPKKWHLDVYVFAALLTCIWSILDFYHMSPIGWQDISGGDTAFRSAFGNINTVSGYQSLVLAISTTLFVTHREQKTRANVLRTLFYGFTSAAAFMALVTVGSDNAILGVGAVAAFLPFVAFSNLRDTTRYVIAIGLWLLTPFGIQLGIYLASQSVKDTGWGTLQTLMMGHLDIMAVFLLADIAIVVVLMMMSSGGRKIDEGRLARILRRTWFALGVVAVVGIIAILYDANTGGHQDLYEDYSYMLIFNDSWGSGRGYIWRLAFSYMRKFNLRQFLIGTGPETFFVFNLENSYTEMMERGGTVYDSPHSEQIQYLFTTGILGFISFYGWLATSAISGIKAHLKKIGPFASYAAAFAFGVIAHFFVSAINICAPTAFPLTVLILALIPPLTREEKIP